MAPYKYKLSSFAETKRMLGVDVNLVEPILFGEKLYVFNEHGKKIGRFHLNIDQEEKDDEKPKALYVHISNRAYINGKLSESIVTGTVTPRLKTLEEIRYECTEVSHSGKHERCMFLLRETTKYYLSVTNTISEMKSYSRKTIPFVEALGIISECANAVLLRKMARKGYEGILCLKAVLSNGKRCRNYYVSKLSEQVINGKRKQVLVIYRNITNHKKCNVTMTMALTRAGQIVYLFWSNSKCFIHFDPDIEVNTNFFTDTSLQLHRFWHRDIQLHSLYLDRVELQKMKHRSHILQREPLRRILADFVEHVLLMKPKDVICFAIGYFSAFGRQSAQSCRSKISLPKEPVGSASEIEDQDDDYRYMWTNEQSFSGEA